PGVGQGLERGRSFGGRPFRWRQLAWRPRPRSRSGLRGGKPLVGMGLGLAISLLGILWATVRILPTPVPVPGPSRSGSASLRPGCSGAGTRGTTAAQGLLVLLRQRGRLLSDRADLPGSLDQGPAAERVASHRG